MAATQDLYGLLGVRQRRETEDDVRYLDISQLVEFADSERLLFDRRLECCGLGWRAIVTLDGRVSTGEAKGQQEAMDIAVAAALEAHLS